MDLIWLRNDFIFSALTGSVFNSFSKLIHLFAYWSQIWKKFHYAKGALGILWNPFHIYLICSWTSCFSSFWDLKARVRSDMKFRWQNNQIFMSEIEIRLNPLQNLPHHLLLLEPRLLMNAKCLFPSNSLWWRKVFFSSPNKTENFL